MMTAMNPASTNPHPSTPTSIIGTVALELVPLVAPVLGFALLFAAVMTVGGTPIEFVMVPVFLITIVCVMCFFASGVGWLAAGYDRVGLVLLAVRGGLALTWAGVYLHEVGENFGCGGSDCNQSNLMPLFWLVVLTPVASAIFLAVTTIATGVRRNRHARASA